MTNKRKRDLVKLMQNPERNRKQYFKRVESVLRERLDIFEFNTVYGGPIRRWTDCVALAPVIANSLDRILGLDSRKSNNSYNET